ncbi:hypothetical protein [Azospirillum sp.]|uniref:hypothetical protein n=1 Tax=Azospirillum sp. TaxID=34012 RepID=UPI002D632E4B|nr:hypothetical protein [Azospirillum sp.]HYD71452.1 hypothetical protein [Azospirillum sp.]
MLREAWEYLTTPAGAEARAFGYLAEAVALGARHRRQRAAWAPHVAACRHFILDAASRAPATGGAALVAGSGRLIEVPLAELAARFESVVLADLIHPPAARRAARRFANVRLAEVDVTGALKPLDAALRGGGPLPSPAPPDLGGRFAFAVSCNLLSQLPLLPLDAIARRAPAVGEAERAAFATALVAAHLEWLKRAGTVAALVTDVESLWLKDGTVLEREGSLWGAALPAPDVTWDWNIAPRPEEDRWLDLRHAVGGWYDLNASPA